MHLAHLVAVDLDSAARALDEEGNKPSRVVGLERHLLLLGLIAPAAPSSAGVDDASYEFVDAAECRLWPAAEYQPRSSCWGPVPQNPSGGTSPRECV
jgi:hypothetical protein